MGRLVAVAPSWTSLSLAVNCSDLVEESDEELTLLALLDSGQRLSQLLELHWSERLDMCTEGV